MKMKRIATQIRAELDEVHGNSAPTLKLFISGKINVNTAEHELMMKSALNAQLRSLIDVVAKKLKNVIGPFEKTTESERPRLENGKVLFLQNKALSYKTTVVMSKIAGIKFGINSASTIFSGVSPMRLLYISKLRNITRCENCSLNENVIGAINAYFSDFEIYYFFGGMIGNSLSQMYSAQ